MRRFPVVITSLALSALAPAGASDRFEDIDSLANGHMATCVAPYIAASLPEQDVLLARLVESKAGAELLARMGDGAPTQWRTYFGDQREPLDARIGKALNLVGMAISHGDGEQKAIARAYSAYYLSAATQGECPAPVELTSFVAGQSFWPAQSTAPSPSASPPAPIAPNP